MKTQGFEIPGLLQIQLDVRGDERGFFVERYQAKKFEELGLPTHFVQDNHSRSAPGVLRGLHYQHSPGQGKLVGVARGRILDIVVDLRPKSPTFGRHEAVELTDLNGRLLWIPAGLAHGFAVLGEEPADLIYKVDSLYNAAGEGGVAWNDPDLGIPWTRYIGPKSPTLSARDLSLPRFADYKLNIPEAFRSL